MKPQLKLEKPEDLYFLVFLIVVANLLLMSIWFYPFVSQGKSMPVNIQSAIIIINSLIFYMLFLIFLNYYVGQLGTIMRENKTKTIIILSIIGLLVMAVISYFTLGFKSTMEWVIFAIVTLLVIYLSRLIEKGKEKKEEK